jgi:hypothetical protein
MKQLALTVALCFAFAVVGYADRCSDLCNACKRSPRDISTCCQAESACYRNGVQDCSAAEGKCDSLKFGGGNGDNYDNHQHFPVFNEWRREQEAREVADRAIYNFQNLQQQQWGGGGVVFGH